MSDPGSGERQNNSNIYLTAKLMGGMAVGLAIIGGVEKLTPMREAATPTWVLAGCAAVGALAGAAYDFFVNRGQ